MEHAAEPIEMAKKKARRPKAAQSRLAVAIVVKGSPEWKKWVEEASACCRMSVSTMVDLALAEFVKGCGFDKKPPRR